MAFPGHTDLGYFMGRGWGTFNQMCVISGRCFIGPTGLLCYSIGLLPGHTDLGIFVFFFEGGGGGAERVVLLISCV